MRERPAAQHVTQYGLVMSAVSKSFTKTPLPLPSGSSSSPFRNSRHRAGFTCFVRAITVDQCSALVYACQNAIVCCAPTGSSSRPRRRRAPGGRRTLRASGAYVRPAPCCIRGRPCAVSCQALRFRAIAQMGRCGHKAECSEPARIVLRSPLLHCVRNFGSCIRGLDEERDQDTHDQHSVWRARSSVSGEPSAP
jgi:hypothetical protein